MKLISYQNGRGPRIAGLRGQEIIDLNDADPTLPSCPKALLKELPGVLARAEKALAAGSPVGHPLTWLPPVPSPEKIVCIGLNYADHARETKAAIPSCPVVFNKFPTALLPHEGTVRLPRASQMVDYEAELVLVIGRSGRHIAQSDARGHIAAYTCGNDVSARDWQKDKPGGQWLSGKSFDTFAPCGPWMVTADEIPEPGKLGIRLRLNGHVMQDSNTCEFIFPVDHLVSYISQFCTLHPGDLIYTGTPGGVGVGRTPPVYLKPGDVTEVEIERIGVLRNRFERE
ncbi:MAG TPA: fumarylacetoacetate hydrolase family protein [Pirellulales bacterium]|nr:fumarylacetoacetate hydrolase family protein [Pirellulales bacterium]